MSTPTAGLPYWARFCASHVAQDASPHDAWLDGWRAAAAALHDLVEVDDAARTVWSTWVASMQLQGRDVSPERLAWESLDPRDQQIDQNIAHLFGRYLIHALMAEELPIRGTP